MLGFTIIAQDSQLDLGEEETTQEDFAFDEEEPSSSKNWANSTGSCYGKGDMNVTIGFPIWPWGFYGSFDYGFHDCISGGGGLGYYGYSFNSFWDYRFVPFVVRGAFHPFNLSVLADKVKVRNKLDVYGGISMGFRIGYAKWEGLGEKLKSPAVGGFVFREYIGIRFYPTENFFLTAEEGGLMWLFNIGVGLKF